MKLETSAKLRLFWALFCFGIAGLFLIPALTVKGAEVMGAVSFPFLMLGLVVLSSWSKVRQKMQALDYQARAIGKHVGGSAS